MRAEPFQRAPAKRLEARDLERLHSNKQYAEPRAGIQILALDCALDEIDTRPDSLGALLEDEDANEWNQGGDVLEDVAEAAPLFGAPDRHPTIELPPSDIGEGAANARAGQKSAFVAIQMTEDFFEQLGWEWDEPE
jgi:hypothetical protein